MEKKKNISSKQLIAFILCAVFLSVHVIKFFHHHDPSSFKKQISTGIEQVKKAADCSICDYYFAKNSHNQTDSTQIEAPQIISPSYSDYLSQRLTSIGLASADRGPPALF